METVYPLLKYFAYTHLPEHLQAVSKPYSDLANKLAEEGKDCLEVETGLRKLLEAKDCAVRASL